jgi:F0F1-type ATP synthase delta subunit
MKYPVSTYAEALAQVVLESGDSTVAAKNFIALLRKNGDEKHLGKILGESERLIHREQGIKEIVVESARKLKQPPRALLKDLAKPEDEIREVIRPDLIAGIKVVIDGELQFDGSFKGKVDKMFG